MRECVNCEHSRGLGSDVWCSKGFETSYMDETDCCHFKGFGGSEKYTNRGSTVYENDEELSTIDVVDLLNEQQATISQLEEENKKLIEEWEFSFRTEMAHHRFAEKELQEKIREKQATISRLEEKNGALKKFIKDNFDEMMDSKMVIDDEL